jgi:hypothetical protein
VIGREEQTAKCPEGYRYGHAWLVEPLPDAVVDRVNEIVQAIKHAEGAAYTSNLLATS